METNHTMTCGCCGAGTVAVRVDDKRQFHPDRCSHCGKTPLTCSPESHAKLMAAHDAQQDPNAAGSLCAQDPLCYEKPIPCPHHVERPAGSDALMKHTTEVVAHMPLGDAEFSRLVGDADSVIRDFIATAEQPAGSDYVRMSRRFAQEVADHLGPENHEYRDRLREICATAEQPSCGQDARDAAAELLAADLAFDAAEAAWREASTNATGDESPGAWAVEAERRWQAFGEASRRRTAAIAAQQRQGGAK